MITSFEVGAIFRIVNEASPALRKIRQTAKAANIRPRRVAIAVLSAIEVEKRLGPSRPTPAKPVKPKLPPKPPRSQTRVREIEANIELGRQLLAIRSENVSNCSYGRIVRARFGIDAQRAGECSRVARVYGNKPEVFRRLSWASLLELSAAMPAPVRAGLEARILAGDRVSNERIRRARQAQANRQARPAARMAA